MQVAPSLPQFSKPSAHCLHPSESLAGHFEPSYRAHPTSDSQRAHTKVTGNIQAEWKSGKCETLSTSLLLYAPCTSVAKPALSARLQGVQGAGSSSRRNERTNERTSNAELRRGTASHCPRRATCVLVGQPSVDVMIMVSPPATIYISISLQDQTGWSLILIVDKVYIYYRLKSHNTCNVLAPYSYICRCAVCSGRNAEPLNYVTLNAVTRPPHRSSSSLLCNLPFPSLLASSNMHFRHEHANTTIRRFVKSAIAGVAGLNPR